MPLFSFLAKKLPPSNVAIAFDIDGVLTRGRNPIPGAVEALRRVHQARIPHIFLTNGGGMFEHRKAAQLTQLLHVPVTPEQVVLSHTPIAELAPHYAEKLVLVTGNEECPLVAQSYGFHFAVGVSHFLRREPSLWPYCYANTPEGRAGLRLCPMPPEKIQLSRTDPHTGRPSQPVEVPHPFYTGSLADVEAVFLFHDGIDWGSEMQIISDALIRGYERRLKSNPAQQPLQPRLYATNPDFLWKNEQDHPRYAQGMFLLALEQGHERSTGRKVETTFFGKPTAATFDFAERALYRFIALVHSGRFRFVQDAGAEAARDASMATRPYVVPATEVTKPPELERIFMIGDNPSGDIRGANQKGWESVLVKTGVFNPPKHLSNDPVDPAKFVFDNVSKAIDYILSQRKQ